MTNKELGEFISIENYSKTSKELLKKTEDIIGVGADLVTTFFMGVPIYAILKPFIQDLRNWKSRVELKQLAYFLIEFESLNQNERSEFSYMIQNNEEDFTERLFYYITQLNDKKKSMLCGKLGVAYARRKLDSNEFLRLVQIVQRSNYLDLLKFKEHIMNFEMRGKDRFEQFIKPIERFTGPSTFSSILNKDEVRLIWSLINLELAIQEINFKGIREITHATRHRKLELDKVAKSLSELKVNHRLTTEAYFLYHHGLALIDTE